MPRSVYTLEVKKPTIQRLKRGERLKRHPFSGLVYSAVELLHNPWWVTTSMSI